MDHAESWFTWEVKTEDGLKSDVSAETGMRAAYQQWKKLMTA